MYSNSSRGTFYLFGVITVSVAAVLVGLLLGSSYGRFVAHCEDRGGIVDGAHCVVRPLPPQYIDTEK